VGRSTEVDHAAATRTRDLERELAELGSLAALATGDVPCWIVDANWSDLRHVNRAARELFELAGDDLAPSDLLAQIDPLDHERLGVLSLRGGHAPAIRLRTRARGAVVLACTAVLRRRPSGEIVEIAFLASDVSRASERRDEAETIAQIVTRPRASADRAWAALAHAIRVALGAASVRITVADDAGSALAEDSDGRHTTRIAGCTTSIDVRVLDDLLVVAIRDATNEVHLGEDSRLVAAIHAQVRDLWKLDALRAQLARERRTNEDAEATRRALAEAEQALELSRIAYDGAVEAAHTTSAQLADFSHECRGVLNSVCGFAQLLSRGELDPAQRKAVDHILVAGQHLTALLDDVLEVTRLDGLGPSTKRQTVSVAQLVDESVALAATALTDHQVALRTTTPDVAVETDPNAARQVLVNLLTNAAKYAGRGARVEVSARVIGPLVRVAVTDDGPGIPPERRARLFQRFERGGLDATDRRGTGLGLALCRRLIESLDGSIGVESEVGRGSTFWFELPAAPSANDAHADAARTKTGSRTVVAAIPDDPTIELIDLAARLDVGWRALMTRTCTAAIEIVRRHRPEVVIVDVGLDRSDQLIAAAHSIPHVVVVATTTELPDSSHPGVDVWLRKPWSLDDMAKVLRT
jgi:signal transduction histidine kinase